ncbi:RNA-directed DNA polymerase, eukaryota, reverse transcriptase zinc-binding domain protein [Tanacetum coccineum]
MSLKNGALILNLEAKVKLLDLKADSCGLSTVEVEERISLIKQLDYVDHIIKRAVWNCRSGKAPGPDGFTFKFIKLYWETIGKDFVNMVKRPISLIGCQFKIIAKVLANRLQQVVHSVISEVQTAFVKVDFEKAFDSFDWNFLDHTMEQMGFTLKWRSWIQGCLNSAYGSVLVDGSPTKEFKIQKGLRQGDPLSPFLFILAMEALHVSLEEAKSKNIFEGVKGGSDKVDISHLQFVDDTLLMAPKCVLKYLEKLRRNFFWGGSVQSNKLAWVSWKKVCSPSTRGGLGIGSLQAANLAM